MPEAVQDVLPETQEAAKPLSRQQQWQRRMKALGRCRQCGRPRAQDDSSRCDTCQDLEAAKHQLTYVSTTPWTIVETRKLLSAYYSKIAPAIKEQYAKGGITQCQLARKYRLRLATIHKIIHGQLPKQKQKGPRQGAD